MRASCSSTPSTMGCRGVYRALTRWPGPGGGSGGRSVRARRRQRVPAGAQAPREGGHVEQHPGADRGLADQVGVGQGADEPAAVAGEPRQRHAHSTAPGQRPTRSTTVPLATDHARERTGGYVAGERRAMSAATSAAQARPSACSTWSSCLLYTRRPLSKAQIRQLVPQYGQSPRPRPSSGCSSATRTTCASWASRSSPRTSTRSTTTSPATASTSTSTPCPTSTSSPTSSPCSAWPAAPGRRPAWPARPPRPCASCAPPGVERDVDALIGIEPRLRTTEPAFDAVKDGVVRRRAAPLLLPAPEAAEATERRVQPWSLVSWHGHWYLNAFDVDRGARGSSGSRASSARCAPTAVRARSRCPTTTSPRSWSRRVAAPQTQPSPAVLRVRRGAGHSLRRRARTVGEVDGHVGPRRHRPPRPRGLRRGGRRLRSRRRRRAAARARRRRRPRGCAARSPRTGEGDR